MALYLENIGYGKESCSISDIILAAKLAELGEFIQNLTDRYPSFIEEKGIKLSAGQRQRLSLAHAILNNVSYDMR